MDRRERGGSSQTEVLLSAFQSMQAGLWTAMPGIVASDLVPGKRTVTVQPAIRAQVQKKDGTFELVALPVLLDCPVFFTSGGGVTLTFPVKAGDECLVVFASRCIDGWWQSSGVQNQADMRKHDLSDGFALVGVSSVPKVITNISTSRAQLRSDDQQAFVEIDPASHFVRVRTTGKIELNADSDILIQSGTKIDIKAPLINVEATTSVITKAPILQNYGNMTWFGYTGGAGTVTMNGMTINWSNATFNWSNVNLVAAGGSLSHDGRNIGGSHIHNGVQTGAGNTGQPQP